MNMQKQNTIYNNIQQYYNDNNINNKDKDKDKDKDTYVQQPKILSSSMRLRKPHNNIAPQSTLPLSFSGNNVFLKRSSSNGVFNRGSSASTSTSDSPTGADHMSQATTPSRCSPILSPYLNWVNVQSLFTLEMIENGKKNNNNNNSISSSSNNNRPLHQSNSSAISTSSQCSPALSPTTATPLSNSIEKTTPPPRPPRLSQPPLSSLPTSLSSSSSSSSSTSTPTTAPPTITSSGRHAPAEPEMLDVLSKVRIFQEKEARNLERQSSYVAKSPKSVGGQPASLPATNSPNFKFGNVRSPIVSQLRDRRSIPNSPIRLFQQQQRLRLQEQMRQEELEQEQEQELQRIQNRPIPSSFSFDIPPLQEVVQWCALNPHVEEARLSRSNSSSNGSGNGANPYAHQIKKPYPPFSRPDDDEAANTRHANTLQLLAELSGTEEDYLRDVDHVIGWLRPLLLKKRYAKSMLLSLVTGIEFIRNISATLVDDIKASRGGDQLTVGAAIEVFQRAYPFLRLYSEYCKNYSKSIAFVSELSKSDGHFSQVLKDIMDDPLSRGLGLPDFLIKPIQRLCKYPLFFNELIKNTADEVVYAELIEVHQNLNQVAVFINQCQHHSDDNERLVKVQESVDNVPFAIFDSSRRLLKELSVRLDRESGETRHLFLFNDILLFAKPKGKVTNRYQFSACIPLHAATIIMYDVESSISIKGGDAGSSIRIDLFFANADEMNELYHLMYHQMKEYRVHHQSAMNRTLGAQVAAPLWDGSDSSVHVHSKNTDRHRELKRGPRGGLFAIMDAFDNPNGANTTMNDTQPLPKSRSKLSLAFLKNKD
ncbi:hypothetical protein SAMD00019534_105670 [Acytostelium subglobosum LB1]|uniref:hypothetical protein n=1 Tax=Acytostelium subglobosum LB1 TaxID=1410327 RepID=UPI000644FA33|nr:hypothetical protein SAMD00019534_105670 [Acytostelium subglobosum LB1]GAM27392.1 hypothetical protein SAMD00019534_105670 [Acytostelium subglobosum LB1]|eukprot:XP_012749859.1 hypothetical protein SAMD00019534_105670 [Acytostelium subglobosum LB1]